MAGGGGEGVLQLNGNLRIFCPELGTAQPQLVLYIFPSFSHQQYSKCHQREPSNALHNTHTADQLCHNFNQTVELKRGLGIIKSNFTSQLASCIKLGQKFEQFDSFTTARTVYYQDTANNREACISIYF